MSYHPQNGPLWLLALKSPKDMFLLWKKNQCRVVLPDPFCTVVLPRNWGQENVGVGLVKKKKKKTNRKGYVKAEPFSSVHCVQKNKIVQEPSQMLSDLYGNTKCNLHRFSPKIDLMFFSKSSPIWRNFARWRQTHCLPMGDTISLKSLFLQFYCWWLLTEKQKQNQFCLNQKSHEGANFSLQFHAFLRLLLDWLLYSVLFSRAPHYWTWAACETWPAFGLWFSTVTK